MSAFLLQVLPALADRRATSAVRASMDATECPVNRVWMEFPDELGPMEYREKTADMGCREKMGRMVRMGRMEKRVRPDCKDRQA